jgi:hypothetical protein
LLIAFLQFLNTLTEEDLVKLLIFKLLQQRVDTAPSISFEEFKKKTIEEIKQELFSFYKKTENEIAEDFQLIASYLETTGL